MKQVLIENMAALFRANNNSLRVTCVGHDELLAGSAHVSSEAELIEEISPVLDGVSLYAEIRLTNDYGHDVFRLVSDDPRQA